MTSGFGLTTDGSHSILILSILGVCSLHNIIRILDIGLNLLGFFNFFNLFNFFNFFGFLGPLGPLGLLSLLDSRPTGPLFLPFLEASSAFGEDSPSRGRRNVAKLRKLLPVNLPRRLAFSSDTVEIQEHTLSLTLVFSMHRYPITRYSVWLEVSPTDFTGSEAFSCFLA